MWLYSLREKRRKFGLSDTKIQSASTYYHNLEKQTPETEVLKKKKFSSDGLNFPSTLWCPKRLILEVVPHQGVYHNWFLKWLLLYCHNFRIQWILSIPGWNQCFFLSNGNYTNLCKHFTFLNLFLYKCRWEKCFFFKWWVCVTFVSYWSTVKLFSLGVKQQCIEIEKITLKIKQRKLKLFSNCIWDCFQSQ